MVGGDVACLQIEDFRKQTKAEKKRMAMAMRKKQLNQLGMMVGAVAMWQWW